MGLEPNLPFALWLLPASNWADRLENCIGELAQRHGTDPFVPHVTIASGTGSADAANCESAVECLARKWCPLELKADGLDWGPGYFTFFFLRLEQPPGLDLIGEALASCPGCHGPAVGLHLSLLYADATPGSSSLAIDRAALEQEFLSQLDPKGSEYSLSFDRLALVQPGPGGWRYGRPWRIDSTFH